MNDKNNWVLKVIATVSYLAIAAAILVASNSPTDGYELSIYSATPLAFWLLLLVGIVGGIWMIVSQAFEDSQVAVVVIVGPLVFANLAILSLPIIRGYFLYAGHDSLAHMGMGFDVILETHTDINNVYPAIHILIAQISQVCDVDPVVVGRYLPIFLNLLFTVVLTYLIGKASLLERGARLLVLSLSPLFFLNSLHIMVYPQVLSFLLVLFLLYVRIEKNIYETFPGRMILVLVLFAIPYSHPSPALIVILLLLMIELADALYRRALGNQASKKMSANLAVIATITFFSWISSFVLFDVKVRTLWSNLRDPFAAPQVQNLGSAIEGLSLGDAASVLFKMYGDSIICLLLGAVGAVIVIQKVRLRQKGLHRIWMLTWVFLISIPVQLLVFAGARSQTVGRLLNLNFSVFLAPVLAAYALHEVLGRRLFAIRIVVAKVIATLILMAIWMTSILGLYQSPWILQPGWQVTRMDIQGTDWFLERKDHALAFTAMGYPHGTQYASSIGYSAAFTREDIIGSMRQHYYDIDQVLPQRFGYDRFVTLGESFHEDRYLIIGKRFLMATANPKLSSRGMRVIPLFWPGFQPEDFAQLDEDPSLGKLYSNGELDIWRVFVQPCN